MKKFFIPLFAVAFTAAVVNAADAKVEAPKVEAAKPEVKAEAPKADAAKDAAAPAAPVKTYWVSAQENFKYYLTDTISNNPWKSVAATVVLTIAAVKAIDYAVAADEDQEF